MREFTLGIDLGGTSIKLALVATDGTVAGKATADTPADAGPEAVMDAMADAGIRLLEDTGVAKSAVLAAGVGAPGPMNWQTGIVYSPPNLEGWENVPLAEKMHDRLQMPVFVDNDANCACYGEFWLGAGQGAKNMGVLTLGTGVGGGVIVFGQLLRGIDGTAGELGHLKVQRNGRKCGCGALGCLEAYASVSGMVRTAREGIESGRETTLDERCGGDLGNLTGAMISSAADEGDVLAQWVIEETAIWLAQGISSMINYQNPEKIVLCGGMIAAGERLFEPVRRTVKENTFQVPAERCEILPAGLGADSGVLGAAGCALDRLRNQPEAQ